MNIVILRLVQESWLSSRLGIHPSVKSKLSKCLLFLFYFQNIAKSLNQTLIFWLHPHFFLIHFLYTLHTHLRLRLLRGFKNLLRAFATTKKQSLNQVSCVRYFSVIILKESQMIDDQ